MLSYGFPYREAPKTYIRKLTLAPSVEAFQLLRKGDSITLTWELAEIDAADFSECVQRTWEYCYDTNRPQPVDTPYTVDRMKEVLSNFFVESYVDNTPTHYYSGVELKTATCDHVDVAEIGFVGRTLLNAFNALEYGALQNRQELMNSANSVLIRIFRTVSLRQAFSMRWYIIIVALKNPSTVSAANQRVCMPC